MCVFRRWRWWWAQTRRRIFLWRLSWLSGTCGRGETGWTFCSTRPKTCPDKSRGLVQTCPRQQRWCCHSQCPIQRDPRPKLRRSLTTLTHSPRKCVSTCSQSPQGFIFWGTFGDFRHFAFWDCTQASYKCWILWEFQGHFPIGNLLFTIVRQRTFWTFAFKDITVTYTESGTPMLNWDSRYLCHFSTEMAEIWSPGTSFQDVWTCKISALYLLYFHSYETFSGNH